MYSQHRVIICLLSSMTVLSKERMNGCELQWQDAPLMWLVITFRVRGVTDLMCRSFFLDQKLMCFWRVLLFYEEFLYFLHTDSAVNDLRPQRHPRHFFTFSGMLLKVKMNGKKPRTNTIHFECLMVECGRPCEMTLAVKPWTALWCVQFIIIL